MNTARYTRILSLTVLSSLAALGAVGCGDSEDGGAPASTAVTPLDPAAEHYGQSYAEWSADWWRWAYAAPASTHPIVDTTGEHCAVGQDTNSPVFFLGGTFGGDASRACAFDHGKAIFFPILNASWDNGGVPTADQVDEATLEANALAALDAMQLASMVLTVDGEAIEDLERYRVEPFRFDYDVPATDNIYSHFGMDFSGHVDPSYTVGYWVMLPPLPAGAHTIHFAGAAGTAEAPFSLDVTYALDLQ